MNQFAQSTGIRLAVVGVAVCTLSSCGVDQEPRVLPIPRFVHAQNSPMAVGPAMQKVIVAEMNGDEFPDIVVTCGGTRDGRPDPHQGYVAVLVGSERTEFRLGQPLIPIGMEGAKAAVGDINGDQRADIAVIAHDTYDVTLLTQDETGQFDVGRKQTLLASDGSHPHTHDVAMADVNGDGKLDILTTSADDNVVSVLLGDGRGGFEPSAGSPFPAGNHPYEGLSLGDLNGDGSLDVVVPNLLGQAVSVLLGDGAGGFTHGPGSPLTVGDRPGFVTLGDLNGDSILDIVATHDDDPIVYVLRGDGQGGFQPAPDSPVTLSETVWGAAIGDVNGDGKNDLVLGAKEEHILILLGDGDRGFFGDPVIVPMGGRGPANLVLADVDRDGKLDVITSNFDSGDVAVLLQQ